MIDRAEENNEEKLLQHVEVLERELEASKHTMPLNDYLVQKARQKLMVLGSYDGYTLEDTSICNCRQILSAAEVQTYQTRHLQHAKHRLESGEWVSNWMLRDDYRTYHRWLTKRFEFVINGDQLWLGKPKEVKV